MEQYELDAIERLVTRPARGYRTIEVAPLTQVIGAEVSGVDLTKELPDDQLAEIKAAFLDHHVLVLRDQDISREDHLRFASHFGELRPVNPPPPEGDPHILEIVTTPGAEDVAGNAWHADGTADLEPSLGSMLHILETPEGTGGDTLFANMHLAYDLLSPTMRDLLDGLTSVHDGRLAFGDRPIPKGHITARNEHPVVVRHPETGRKLLYVNPIYTQRIPQLSAPESRALLDMLYQTVSGRPLLQCRVRWEPNTLVFWDNRCVQHHVSYDYYPLARYGRRIAINGGPLKG
ncbi:TauD/TfdA dioxygenase family protein [Streptomyces sp. NPDC014733]|uniref:TauD/TfdA dioxygenase family protein n=1 Tax=Streptomyces sp. NPDC014733 TaxID=3364885 RepID=UPI0036FD9DDD